MADGLRENPRSGGRKEAIVSGYESSHSKVYSPRRRPSPSQFSLSLEREVNDRVRFEEIQKREMIIILLCIRKCSMSLRMFVGDLGSSKDTLVIQTRSARRCIPEEILPRCTEAARQGVLIFVINVKD